MTTLVQSQMSVFNAGKYYTERRTQTAEMKTPEAKARIKELKSQVSKIVED